MLAGVVAAGFGGAFLLGGCASGPRPHTLPRLVETIAVLPFDNETNDLDAPDIMQKLAYLALQGAAFVVSDIDATNARLREMGIVDGGQLPVLDPVQIGRDLGVQGLLYGYVESFGYVNIGVYVARRVRLDLRLVDALTGAVLWENTGGAATQAFAFDEKSIKRNFALGLADQLADKITKSPLAPEAREATARALRTLPGFRFAGFAGIK